MDERVILLIEDNADDAFLALRVIGKVCSEQVLVARDGEEAELMIRSMLANQSYPRVRLVLLDLKLPKITGLELLEMIRSHPALKGLPVAILTSSENEGDQERCRELGVLDYIFKPMTVNRLQQLLAREEERTGGTPG